MGPRPDGCVLLQAGGVETPGEQYTPPLYRRVHVPRPLFRSLLASWRQELQAVAPCARQPTVDVCIPTFHASTEQLDRWPPGRPDNSIVGRKLA